MNNIVYDGVIKSEFISHLSEVAHRRTQPTEDLILRRNAELRKNPGSINDLGAGSIGGTWGRMIASIPFNLFEEATRNGYDLSNRNAEVAGMEMNRYLQSFEGQKCLVQG